MMRSRGVVIRNLLHTVVMARYIWNAAHASACTPRREERERLEDSWRDDWSVSEL